MDNNYQTIKSPTSDTFAYEEFSGRDGRTCPTCHGTGRVSKDEENELVALIPYNDARLKPSKTKQYVIISVIFTLLACGLTLFFVLPKSIQIEDPSGGFNHDFTNYTVTIKDNSTHTNINVTKVLLIKNQNFFSVRILNITLAASFDKPSVSVGNGFILKDFSVPARTNMEVPVSVNTTFSPENKLGYVGSLCTGNRIHDIVMQFNIVMTSSYLQHSEQNSVSSYNYIDCSLHLNVIQSPNKLAVVGEMNF